MTTTGSTKLAGWLDSVSAHSRVSAPLNEHCPKSADRWWPGNNVNVQAASCEPDSYESWAILRRHPYGPEVGKHSVNPCLALGARNTALGTEPAVQDTERRLL
jgi:hypothetical protein